jgi:hypothetical protein
LYPQKLSVSSYKELFQLREKILSLGGKDPGPLDEMNPLGSIILNSKAGDGAMENSNADNESKDMKLITHLEENLGTIAESSFVFCRDALNKLNDIVIWLTNIEREFWDNPSVLKSVVR